MKNKSFIKKLLVLLVVLITSIPQMWAETKYNWTANKVLYYDNSSTQWAQPYLRIGCGSGDGDWSNYYAMEAVPGTQNCWKYTFGNGYSNYAAFHVANNTGGHNYNVYWEGSSNAWTECIDWQKYAVSGHIILSTSESGKKYCSVTKTSGDTKFSVTYSTAGTGSGTLSVTKYNGTSYDAFTSGNSVLPTQIMKIVATPDPGNALTSFSVSGATQIGESNTYYVTANTTISATFTPEETHDVTVSYKCGAMTIANSTTESAVGVTTTRSVSAPAINDHTWASWTVGNGIKNNTGNTTTNPININTKASGSYTLQANYTLVPCSLYIHTSSGTFATQEAKYLMSYDPDVDAYYYEITTTSSPYYFRFYHNNATQYSAAWEGGSYPNIQAAAANGDKITCDQNVNLWGNKSSVKFTGLSGSTIKIWFDYQNKKTWITETTYSVAVTSENAARGTVNAASVMAGKNTAASINATPVTNSGWMFKQWSVTSPASLVSSATTASNSVKATGGSGAVQAQFKHRYILRGSIDADGNPAGGMAGWDATDNSAYATASISDGVMTITANLTKAKTKYKFKIYDLSGSSWKGQTETTDIPDNTARTLSGSNNVTLTTTAAGTYTFVYTVSSNSIKVLFPSPVYSVTYGVQSGTGTVTAKIGTESIGASPGKAVGGANVVMTASDGTGYQFQKWVNESGTQISTSNPYTISSIAANCTIKAVFTARNYTATNNLKDADGNAGQYNVDYDATSIAHTSAPSRDGYTIEGYYKQAAWTNKIANTDLSLVTSSAYTKSGTNKWNQTSAPDLYIKWQQTLTLAGNGAGSTDGSLTMTYNSTTTSGHTAATRTGYTLNGYYTATSGGYKVINNNGTLVSYNSNISSYLKNSSGEWIYDGTPTLSAQWTVKTYTVTLNPGLGGTGDPGTMTVDYDATAYKTFSHSITQTGYTISGWYTNTNVKVLHANGSFVTPSVTGYITSSKWSKDGNCDLYAWWSPNDYTVTLDLDEANKGTIAGADESASVTFDAAPSTIANRPTAANGYALDGYYTESLGEGVKVINADGTWIASVTGYTDGDKKWKHDGDVTLYAYYKKAEVTGITFTGGAVVAPSTSKTVTAVIDPTPTGTATVCWRVLYSNDNPLDPQPEFSSVSGNSVSFTAPATSGMYKMEAVLHLGSGCEGTELSTYVANFQVAGDHEVTVQYKDASGNVIAPSGSVTGKPLEWSSGIEAPEIFGYTFHHWLAGDGVTLSEDGTNAKTGARADSSVVSPIYIKAVYDGRLTAVYNQNAMIYFKNTLGWENVYVNFHTGNAWSNTDNGSGSPKGVGNSGLAEKNRNNHMIQIGESDVYYYDYGAESINPSLYISFTDQSRPSATEFWGTNPGINVVYPANYADALSTDKSSENGFKAATPMFVPLSGVDPAAANVGGGGKANYYNRGYWTTYTAGTGYTLEIYYDNDASECIQSIPFTSADDLMPMKAVVDLEAGTTYRYQVRRGGTSSAGIYYGNINTMTYANHGVGTGWIMENTMAGGFKKAKITTNASGNYTFNLSYSPNASNEYRLRMEVDYPIANNDYRLIYTDATRDSGTRYKPSAIVTKANNSKDTVSFFVRPGSTPVLKIQQATVTGAGAITWNDYSTISSYVDNTGTDALSKDSVYNICLIMNETGAISVENVEGYNGNFYIRTNAAGSSKWDNYRSADHLMTYSEYSEKNADYSHYFMAYVGNGTNIKFVVANDYAPNISDTVKVQTYRGGDASHVDEDGNIKADANVRFMWNKNNNAVYRAYLAAAKSDGSNFLVLRANSNTDLMDENGNALINSANSGEAGYNHKAPDNSMQFTDNENWIYETTVKIKPGAFLKLYANFHDADFYYKGKNNSTFDEDNAIQLLGGSGDAEKIRVIYDFKTDRLVSAWMPTGDIDEVKEIYADVMFVREHQGDIEQLTFSKGDGETMGAITKIETAYGVLRFNKWTINNKSKADGHAVLDPGASRYERDLFYVSFPFRVAMNEVFGFGKYGQHWIIEEYDGAARAANGFWAETPTFWRFITDRKGKFFEPNQGYIIALDLDEMGESSEVWDNGVENVELYFPSYGTMGDITNAEVTYELPSHECTINRPTPDGNRTIKDSHWNVMSVPTYVNTSNVTFSNTTWTATRPSFLYEWNMGDNSLTPRSGSGYTYHAMHAYIVQYAGDVTWTSTSVTPSSIVARRAYAEAPSEVEFRLELSQNEQVTDQAFVRLSNDEEVNAGFAFGEDMSKEFNKTRSNIYTFIGTEQVAGNVLPMSEQTTVVPVGVIAKTTGDYTFAIPEGTEGIGVTLIDNETGIRTSLSALDYTINLTAGTYENRFVLEISPISQVLTDIDNVQSDEVQSTKVRKVMIDGILYIVKDGKVFDATGQRVK